MAVLTGILYAIGAILFILCIRPITTFFHEMGHALPALMFSREAVTVYIGSYGDVSRSQKFTFGRLTIYFRFNLFAWDLGLCSHHGNLTIVQLLIIVFGGPLMSLLIAIILLFQMVSFSLTDGAITIMMLFSLSSLWDFMVNIYPRSQPMQLHTGELTYNDGAQIRRLLTIGTSIQDYNKAHEYLQRGDIDRGVQEFKTIIAKQKYPVMLVDELMIILTKHKRYQEGLELYHDFHDQKNLKTYQYKTLAEIYRGLGKSQEALKAYEQYWYYHFHDVEALNGKAAVLMDLGQYSYAAQDIRTSLELMPNRNLHALLNRIRMNLHDYKKEAVFADLQKVQLWEPNHPLVQFYWGRYYEEMWSYQEALDYYERAKTLGVDYHGIDHRIAEMKYMLGM